MNFLALCSRAGRSLLIVLWTFFLSWVALFSLLISPRGRAYFSLARPWARGCLWLARVRVHIQYAAALPDRPRALFVCNHESIFDIVVLYAVLPRNVVMVAKHTLQYIPLFGWGMRLAGVVFVDRRNPKKAYASLERAKKHLARERSLLIFPEGTCDNGTTLLSFKRGGFALAQACQLPIIPIGLRGVHAVLPPDHALIRGGNVSVRFGEAIPPPSSEEMLQPVMDQTRIAVEKLRTFSEIPSN